MIKNYLLVAWKILLRRKFFTFISLFGICFTLTILLVVGALLDHALVPQAPESKFDRVLTVYKATMRSPDSSAIRSSPPGYELLDKYVRTLHNAEKVAIYTREQSLTVYNSGGTIAISMKQTDAAFWDILDFHFLEGRPFTRDEEQNAVPVAVINAEMRDRLFNGDVAEGRKIALEGKTFRIIGVVKNVPRYRSTAYADVWVPISTMQPPGYQDQLQGSFMGIVLAKHPRDFALLKEEYQRNLQTVVFPDPKKFNSITSMLETQIELFARELFAFNSNITQRIFAFLLFFAVLFMMLPAVNLVNINMSRIMERSSEIGVRKSFGASSQTLAGQFIVENIVLVSIGGIVSLLFASAILTGIELSGVIPYAQFHLNYRIFLGALAASVLFALLSGVYPAWRMSRMHPVAALKGGVL